MIQIKDLYFGYEKENILNGINAKINDGDFVALVGSNGAGKSTLMKLILQINTGYEGSICINGKEVSKAYDYSDVGYVSQKSASFNSQFPATALEVVIGGIGDKKKGIAMLETVGLEGYENHLIGNLSGGQQQKVFIARALLSNPKVLILDEPTVGIDITSAKSICALLDKLNKEKGITILMTTHNLPYIENYINKVLFLDSDGLATMYDANNMTEEDICNIYDHPKQIHSHSHSGCSCGHKH